MRTPSLALPLAALLCAGLTCSPVSHAAPPPAPSIEKSDARVKVKLGQDDFAEVIFSEFQRPIIYPILAPGGVAITRNYPMRDGVAGEPRDHPHHKSLWYAHGSVNGFDTWKEAPDAGRVEHVRLVCADVADGRAKVRTENRWVSPDGKKLCDEERTLTFFAIPEGRVIDVTVKVRASEGEVLLGDTKEGTMAIRTHPNLNLVNDPKKGVTTANGHALNSEGARDKELWGKRARWLDYWGEIDGKTVGVAILDHPANPRHPTWWHAREYGLIAANPFGISSFEKKPKGAGDFKIPAGQSVTWHYRFLFHAGGPDRTPIEPVWKSFAKETIPQ